MDINRFTEKAQEALLAAQQRASRAGNQQVDVEHLLATLLEQDQGLAPAILRKAGVNLDGLKRRVLRLMNADFIDNGKGRLAVLPAANNTTAHHTDRALMMAPLSLCARVYYWRVSKATESGRPIPKARRPRP